MTAFNIKINSMKEQSKKNIKIYIFYKFSALLLLGGSSQCLAPYQSPQITKTITNTIQYGFQLQGTTDMVLKHSAVPSGWRFASFDILASDFPSPTYQPSLSERFSSIRAFSRHQNDPNIIFIAQNNLVVYQRSPSSVLISATESTKRLSPVEHLNETKFVFTAGELGWMYRYDYTDDPLISLAEGQVSDWVRAISQLEREEPTTEFAIGTEG